MILETAPTYFWMVIHFQPNRAIEAFLSLLVKQKQHLRFGPIAIRNKNEFKFRVAGSRACSLVTRTVPVACHCLV